jgi:hypothetical protein
MNTAVGWLVEELKGVYESDYLNKLIEQAKEMEKQQHNKTFVEGLYCESGDSEEFEKYFNRTFKQQEQ